MCAAAGSAPVAATPSKPSMQRGDFHLLVLLDLDFLQRREALGFEREFLAALVRRVGGIAEFFEEQGDRARVRAAQCFAAKAKNARTSVSILG